MSELVDNTMGITLRSTREKLGLSINDVALATKINPRILKALEDGQRDQLPAKSFARGFIRTYAQYLKLDSKPLLESFDSGPNVPPLSHVTRDPEPVQTAKKEEPKEKLIVPTKVAAPTIASAAPSTTSVITPEKFNSKKTNSQFREAKPASRGLLIASILVMVVLIIGIKKIVDKYAHEREIDSPVATAAGGTNVDGKKADEKQSDKAAVSTVVGSTVPGDVPAGQMTPLADGSTAVVAKDADKDDSDDADDDAVSPTTPKKEATKEPTKDMPKSAAPTTSAILPASGLEVSKSPTPAKKPETKKPEPVKAVEKPAEKTAEKTTEKTFDEPTPTAATTPPSDSPKVNKSADAGKPQEVIIEALDSVEVIVQVDGDQAKTLKLTPESVHTIKAKSQIDLQIADGGMVNLIYNGHEKGVPGVLGKPVKLKFP